ncbi:MAG TPA: ferric reductase-like transmembrane domain-containing protein [Solirubrobacterales bacterium]|nr:ferric reductase-like transmembrane domain-containing protein [Solirubrobacterales bacterium]
MIGGVPHTLATQGWWIVSRSSGLVAFVLVTISVFLGLTMAGKPVRQPGFARTMKALHEQTALAALVAIGVHGLAILADPWLKPGVAGVTVPFALVSHRFSVAAGIVAAYLALLLGLSFYFRRQIGPRLWRQAHRATLAVYLLGLLHALGAGSDTGSPLFILWVVGSGVPIACLFVYRLGAARRADERRRRAPRPGRSLPDTA